MESFDYFDELNGCHCLLLRRVSEPEPNALEIEVVEGRTSHVSIPVEVAGQSLGEAFPIRVDKTCAEYALTWNSYVICQITNELFGKKEDAVDGILGKLANIYVRSSLIEYVLRSTSATNGYPSKLAHYQIICSDHIIDVVSTGCPGCLRHVAALPVN
jgi:hypothetical protein